ncbi:MAG: L-threonylcarbamoyladenylate synthase [Saprospiraceae bacterium]|nr:L-threonylcarbamoyladenylate synthase [Saprospiraceae bacterium]
MTIISKNIDQAVEILNGENLVAIPTETVYGLAGNIFSEVAIQKIYKLKQRPLFNPLIVHTYSIDKVKEYVDDFPEKARLLAAHFWPGSLTMVLKKKSIIPDWITSGKDTVAVRIPDHPIVSGLLKALDFPLAAPSANPFGCISPTSPKHVKDYFDGSLKMVLDGGICKNGIESTIIGFENGEPVLYRLGSISIEEIEDVVGEVIVRNKKEVAPDAPGMLARHYAPNTRTFLVENIQDFIHQFENKRIGVLSFKKEIKAPQIVHTEVLSSSGDLKEAASSLYAALHSLDKLNLDMIVAEQMPLIGLGLSINDRLERATKQK